MAWFDAFLKKKFFNLGIYRITDIHTTMKKFKHTNEELEAARRRAEKERKNSRSY